MVNYMLIKVVYMLIPAGLISNPLHFRRCSQNSSMVVSPLFGDGSWCDTSQSETLELVGRIRKWGMALAPEPLGTFVYIQAKLN